MSARSVAERSSASANTVRSSSVVRSREQASLDVVIAVAEGERAAGSSRYSSRVMSPIGPSLFTSIEEVEAGERLLVEIVGKVGRVEGVRVDGSVRPFESFVVFGMSRVGVNTGIIVRVLTSSAA